MNKLFFKRFGGLFPFFWIFVILSCQPAKQNLSIPIIEADVTSGTELKLSEYFTNFRMLKLPYDTVIGAIRKIKYEKNRIYITDKWNLFIFSDDGELLFCFRKRGRGPGEYSEMTDFMVDGETITVLDRNQQRLLTYNHSGENISTRNLGYFAQAISPTIDNSFFLYSDNAFSHKLRRVSDGQDDSLYLAVDKERAKYLFVFTNQNFFKHQNSVYFFQPINDTVYVSAEGGRINPFFYIDFKGKNIPESFFKKQFRDVRVFYDELESKSYAYGVNNFAMYDRFLMFNSVYQLNEKLTVFDHKNHISNTFATIKDDVYFNGLTISVSDFKYYANKRIIVPVDAFSVVKWKHTHPPAEQFQEMVNATKEDDNPLLLIFDFKQ